MAMEQMRMKAEMMKPPPPVDNGGLGNGPLPKAKGVA